MSLFRLADRFRLPNTLSRLDARASSGVLAARGIGAGSGVVEAYLELFGAASGVGVTTGTGNALVERHVSAIGSGIANGSSSARLDAFISAAGAGVGSGQVTVFSPPTATAIVNDTFTDTDGTNLVDHTPDTNTPGNAWEATYGTTTINSNQATLGNGGDGTGIALIDTGQANAEIRAVVQSASSAVGIVFRATDGSNYWALRVASGFVQIFEVTAGGFASRVLDGNPPNLASPFHLVVTLDGDSITAAVEQPIGTTFTTLAHSSSVRNTATKHGLFGAENQQIDELAVTA